MQTSKTDLWVEPFVLTREQGQQNPKKKKLIHLFQDFSEQKLKDSLHQ